MNPLVLICIFTTMFSGMIIYDRVQTGDRSSHNLWTIAVFSCLVWWCFCDAFFYAADTKALAWLWHRLGAVGWCGFISVTGYYYYVLMRVDKKVGWIAKTLYWIPAALLTLRFMVKAPTGLAFDLVQSSSGLGWAYLQSPRNGWMYVFIAYLLLYLGLPMGFVYFWQKTERNSSLRKLARGFLVLVISTVTLGFISIFVIPFFTTAFPSAGCSCVLLFALVYWFRLRDYEFMSVEQAINPRYLLDQCMDAMLLMDNEMRVLYANGNAKRLLGDAELVDKICTGCLDPQSAAQVEAFVAGGADALPSAELRVQGGTPILCSINKVHSRRKHVEAYLLCMNDISQLKRAQERLDYLAHYDEVTGIYNRRGFMDCLARWEADYYAAGTDFELLFMDVASFKQINDTFGHDAGDTALAEIAGAMQGALDAQDVLSRFAGDEFVALHRLGQGAGIGRALSRAVESIDTGAFAPGFTVAIDVGCGRFSEVRDANALLKLADMRMYEKKRKRHGEAKLPAGKATVS